MVSYPLPPEAQPLAGVEPPAVVWVLDKVVPWDVVTLVTVVQLVGTQLPSIAHPIQDGAFTDYWQEPGTS